MHSENLNTNLDRNMEQIADALGNSGDLVTHRLQLTDQGEFWAGVMYIKGLIDEQRTVRLLQAVTNPGHELNPYLRETLHEDALAYLKQLVQPFGIVGQTDNLRPILNALLNGQTILLVGHSTNALLLDTSGGEKRPIAEPTTETVVRGPKEGFTEDLQSNISMVRRRIKDPMLWLEMRKIGETTHTNVALMYMKHTADEKMLQEVRSRLNRIRIDSVLDSGYIEECLKEKIKSPFPTMFASERPDVVSADLLEGRVAILVDGTPFVLTAPALFNQFFQAAEDYYHAPLFSFVRTLRMLAGLASMLIPALYIAITVHHQEMIPSSLLFSLTSQRERIPFPAFIEALFMEITFEVLREAGIRMPRTVGQAISIVGALVLGQAAVEAGLISPAMVIVVSLTAITNLAIPYMAMSFVIRILRFGMMALAATTGLFGIFIGVNLLLIHLCRLQSFGIPYMFPLAPYDGSRQKDVWVRSGRTPRKLFNNRELK